MTRLVDIVALAAANERIVDLYRWLDEQTSTVHTTRGSDCRVQPDGIVLEMFAESALTSDVGVCFWLEARLLKHRSTVEASILIQHDGEQSVLRTTARDVNDRLVGSAMVELAHTLYAWREDGLNHAIKL